MVWNDTLSKLYVDITDLNVDYNKMGTNVSSFVVVV